MKKRVAGVVLALVLILSMTACGGNGNTDADVAGTVTTGDVANDTVDDTLNDAADTSSEPVDTSAPEQILASGNWYGVDGFSNESINGLVIVIHSATTEEVVFDYSSPATNVSNVTASLSDGQTAYVDLGNGIELDMIFTTEQIEVSELEGMGAMLYYFYQ